MNNPPIVSISGLVKRFPIGGDQFTALNGIDLTFGKGEFTGLVGPSGSGKTTLLNIIGSLDVPKSVSPRFETNRSSATRLKRGQAYPIM